MTAVHRDPKLDTGRGSNSCKVTALGAGMGAGTVVVYLGLGSNQGNRQEHLQEAPRELARYGVLTEARSRLFQGPYVGPGQPQGEYLNAALRARTRLTPLRLLEALREVERSRGRRHPSHMLPRPLDVDLLLYGAWCVRHAQLVVPHPRLWERRFVLEPLEEVLEVTHPWRRHLQDRLQALRQRQDLKLHVGASSRREALASFSS